MDRNDVDKLEYKFKSIAYEEVKIIVIILQAFFTFNIYYILVDYIRNCQINILNKEMNEEEIKLSLSKKINSFINNCYPTQSKGYK